MIDFLGLIISGISTIFFSFKEPWDKKVLKTKATLGHIGIVLLIGGLIVSGIMITNSNNEKIEYKTQLVRIQDISENSLKKTSEGTMLLLEKYESSTDELLSDFSKNYEDLMHTIIIQSDSSLKAQLRKIEDDYRQVQHALDTAQDISYRYYFSEEWPYSDKVINISSDMFSFIPIDIHGQLNGTDRYIIWTLIKNNGSYPFHKLDSLQDEIWHYLRPMKLGVTNNLIRLEKFDVIKANYWQKDLIEFTDEFMERLDIYKNYRDTDVYHKKLYELFRKYR
jgi:hypothetical protein